MRTVILNMKTMTGFTLSEIYDMNPDLIVIDLSEIESLSKHEKLLIKNLKLGLPIMVDRKFKEPEEIVFDSKIIVRCNPRFIQKTVNNLLLVKPSINDKLLLEEYISIL